jgi:hypothetical protein
MNASFINSSKRHWLVLIAAVFLASCGGGNNNNNNGSSGAGVSTSNSLPGNTFAATLSNTQAGSTNASSAGAGAVKVDPTAHLLRAVFITAGVTASTVQIRPAQSVAGGPAAIALIETPRGSGVWTASTSVTDAQINALRAGSYVFDVQSGALANGGTQAQIMQQAPASAGTVRSNTAPVTFTNVLTGAQQVPSNSSAATPVAVTLVEPATRTLTAAVITMGIAATGVQIREAAQGANGPAIFTLAQTSPDSGIWFTKNTLTDTQLNSLLAGNYYFVVISPAFPEGEVRGQIGQTAGSGIVGVGGAGTGTTGTGTTGTGTPAFVVGVPGTGNTSIGSTGNAGMGTIGAGSPAAGTTGGGTVGIGSTGIGGTGIGGTGVGSAGTNLPGIGATGIATPSVGTTGVGTIGSPNTGSANTTGTTTTGSATPATGIIGTGSTGTATPGFGATGIGTTGSLNTGSGSTGTTTTAFGTPAF